MTTCSLMLLGGELTRCREATEAILIREDRRQWRIYQTSERVPVTNRETPDTSLEEVDFGPEIDSFSSVVVLCVLCSVRYVRNF